MNSKLISGVTEFLNTEGELKEVKVLLQSSYINTLNTYLFQLLLGIRFTQVHSLYMLPILTCKHAHEHTFMACMGAHMCKCMTHTNFLNPLPTKKSVTYSELNDYEQLCRLIKEN